MERESSYLLPQHKDWPAGTYRTTEEAFGVSEYFIRYARRRWQQRTEGRPAETFLWVEFVEVQFRSSREVTEKKIRLPYGSDTIQILLPDTGLDSAEKDKLRDFYLSKYAPIIQECQSRMCAFLWRTLQDEEREVIGEQIQNYGVLSEKHKAQVFAEMLAAARTVDTGGDSLRSEDLGDGD